MISCTIWTTKYLIRLGFFLSINSNLLSPHKNWSSIRDRIIWWQWWGSDCLSNTVVEYKKLWLSCICTFSGLFIKQTWRSLCWFWQVFVPLYYVYPKWRRVSSVLILLSKIINKDIQLNWIFLNGLLSCNSYYWKILKSENQAQYKNLLNYFYSKYSTQKWMMCCKQF